MKILVKERHLSSTEIRLHFSRLDEDFLAGLRAQVAFDEYLSKIQSLSNHVVAIDGNEIVGAIFYYTQDYSCFITHISVLPEYQGEKIGTQLITHVTEKKELQEIELEVASENQKALHFYLNLGFFQVENRGNFLRMRKEKY